MNTKPSVEEVREVLRKPYSRVLVPDEGGGYTAEILEFRGCFSEGDTPAQAYRNLEEAAFNWVRAALEQGLKVPAPFAAGGYSGRVALRIPKSLHRQAARLAQRDGVSLNQFLLTAISARVGSVEAEERVRYVLIPSGLKAVGTAERLQARLPEAGMSRALSPARVTSSAVA